MVKDNKNNTNQLIKVTNQSKSSLIENQYRVSPLDLETEARYNKFLDLLRSQSPIGMWKLRDISTNSYGFIKQAIRHFEFCHLIKTEIIVNEHGRTEKIIYVPTNKHQILIKPDEANVSFCSPLNKENLVK